MAKKQLTIEEAVEVLERAVDAAMEDPEANIIRVAVETAKDLYGSPTFRAAAYMMYNFGPCLDGEDAASWLESAEELQEVLNGGKS
jgi:hypothetical protein